MISQLTKGRALFLPRWIATRTKGCWTLLDEQHRERHRVAANQLDDCRGKTTHKRQEKAGSCMPLSVTRHHVNSPC